MKVFALAGIISFIVIPFIFVMGCCQSNGHNTRRDRMKKECFESGGDEFVYENGNPKCVYKK